MPHNRKPLDDSISLAGERDDDDFVVRFPVYRSGHFVLGRELHGIEDAQNFVKVAAGARNKILNLQTPVTS